MAFMSILNLIGSELGRKKMFNSICLLSCMLANAIVLFCVGSTFVMVPGLASSPAQKVFEISLQPKQRLKDDPFFQILSLDYHATVVAHFGLRGDINITML